MSDGPRSILANTGYRLLADVGSKVASLVFFVVMARELGESQFGVFTFALTFVILATTLANFGQDQILTREVARDRSRFSGYFANTLAVKIVLATTSLAIAIGIAAVAGIDRETLEALLLLGPAVTLELLMATCFASYQAFERLEFIPVALISQRFVTAAVGIVGAPAGRRGRRRVCDLPRRLCARASGSRSGSSCGRSLARGSKWSPGAGPR